MVIKTNLCNFRPSISFGSDINYMDLLRWPDRDWCWLALGIDFVDISRIRNWWFWLRGLPLENFSIGEIDLLVKEIHLLPPELGVGYNVQIANNFHKCSSLALQKDTKLRPCFLPTL